MTKLLASLMAAGLLAAPFAAHANLIVNGGFEEPQVVPRPSFQRFPTGIPGWTTTFGPGIEIQNNVRGAPYEGLQHVELDSFPDTGRDGNSGMAQEVTTTPGSRYLLSFAYSPRPNQPSSTNGIELWIDGVLLDSFTADGNPDTTNWSIRNYWITGDGATRIEFRAVGTSDNLGGYLDDVRLAVPEPGTLALLGLGLAGLAATHRRKQ